MRVTKKAPDPGTAYKIIGGPRSVEIGGVIYPRRYFPDILDPSRGWTAKNYVLPSPERVEENIRPYVAPEVTVASEVAAEIDQVASPSYRKLAELAGMAAGWDGEEAEQIAPYAVGRASYLIDLIRKGLDRVGAEPLEPYALFPMFSGGLQINWASDGLEFEVDIQADGALSVLEVRGSTADAITDRGQMRLRDAATMIAQAFASR